MNCPACDSHNRPGAQRCKTCAAPLPPTCIACGAKTQGREFCATCRTDRVPTPHSPDELFPVLPEEPTTLTLLPYELRPRFVGREHLLERLVRCFGDAAQQATLTFAVLVGAPGAGKTRLTKELARTLKNTAPTARFLAGSAASHAAVPYGAFVRLLGQRFGITSRDDAERCQDKIVAGLGEVLPASKVPEVAHLLAHMMRVPFFASPIVEPLAENPQQLETRTFIALKRFLAADAARGAMVLCFDDLERAGAETVNLIHYLASALAASPIMLLVVARPSLYDVHPSFGEGEMPLVRVDLGPLDEDEREQLFRELLRHVTAPPPALVAHAKKLDGLPRTLFELARLLLETEVITRDEHASTDWVIDRERLASLRLPADHEDILAHRLAHLAQAERDLLEKASVTGEVFWLDAVVALVRAGALAPQSPDGPSLAEIAASGDHTRVAVAQSLGRLVEREWIAELAESAIPGEREYRFAYPPLRDVVYDRLDVDSRRRYHGLVAQWLELHPEGQGDDSQGEVGRHLERAGDGRGAATRYRRAADGARLAYQNDKAIRLYAQALACLGEGDLAARIQLWHDLGSVYELKGDCEAALGAFERMLRLTWVVSSRSKAAVALNKMGRVWRRKGDLRLALEYLERGKDLFDQSGDERGSAASLDDIGQVQYLLGRYDEAFENISRALKARGKGGDQRSIAHSLSNLGNVQKHRGRFVEAENCYREALELRRGSGDRAGEVTTLNNLAVLAFERGDLDGARRGWEEALRVAEAIGALPLQALALANLGELALATRKLEEARRRLGETIDICREIDDRRLLSEAMRNLGLLELESGDTLRAKELVEHAHEMADSAGLKDFVGRALVALGDVHAATLFDDQASSPGAPSAEDFFRRGTELFRGIGNDGELARSLERYGRFKLEAGDVPSGKELLQEAFTIYLRLGMKAGDDVQRVMAELS
jgi:tetratricopeptide (TPR) repeat protein